MSNETNNFIPELRFPEFDNDGEWEERTLGDKAVSTFVSDKVSVKQLSVDSYISTENMLPDFSGICRISRLPQTGSFTKFTDGDILISNIRPYLKKVWKADKQGGASNDVLVFRAGSKLGSEFLEYILKNDSFINYVMTSAKGVKMPRGDKSSMQGYPIVIPSKEEQQKIASCLSSLDEVIAAQSQKLEALKEHKKGLMQNLFPQEGETVPNYRFPEFENDGEWKQRTIEELIQNNILFAPKDGNHGNIHPKSSDYVKSGIPFIMASDLKNGQIVFSNCNYLRKEQADALQKGFSISGDVLLSHKGTVGEVTLVGDLDFPYLMLTPQVTYYRVKDKSIILNSYLATFFTSELFQRSLMKVSGGGTRAYIGITEQRKLEIIFPYNLKEQQKIADTLASLDALITAQTDKIEQLKLHKKGLMQGLFPKVND